MRRALGMQGARPVAHPTQHSPNSGHAPHSGQPDRRVRRFVRDGEVPVVMLHRKEGEQPETGRIEAAEARFRAEHTLREQAERALHEAQATLQSLKTKLVHAEMAHAEALAGERRAREAAEEALRESLSAQENARQESARQLHARQEYAREAVERGDGPPGARLGQKRVPRIPRGKRIVPGREPQPVRWWPRGWQEN